MRAFVYTAERNLPRQISFRAGRFLSPQKETCLKVVQFEEIFGGNRSNYITVFSRVLTRTYRARKVLFGAAYIRAWLILEHDLWCFNFSTIPRIFPVLLACTALQCPQCGLHTNYQGTLAAGQWHRQQKFLSNLCQSYSIRLGTVGKADRSKRQTPEKDRRTVYHSPLFMGLRSFLTVHRVHRNTISS